MDFDEILWRLGLNEVGSFFLVIKCFYC